MTIPLASPHTDRESTRTTRWLALGIPLATLAALGSSLALSVVDGPVLSATDSTRIDSDLDGMTDFQESILGTDPDEPDTDGDTFTDVEEIARGSDPLSPDSLPTTGGVELGMYASVENGFLALNSAVFVPAGELLDLSFYFGAILDGHPVVIPGSAVASASRKWVYPASGGGHIAIVELAVPEWMIHYVGNVSFFAGATTGDPADPTATRSVSATTVTSMGGTIMSIEPIAGLPNPDGNDDGGDSGDGNGGATDSNQDGGPVGGGVWYRPLGGDDDIPSDLSSGEVCVQSVSFVGTNGASDLYEVSSASCDPMDSYCASSACAGTVGQPLEMPNPGSVFGN